jgi:hypothetical protein
MFTIATDRAVMEDLESRGASLAELLDGANAPATNDVLAQKPRFASIVRGFEEDVRLAQAADPAAGVGMAKSHRLFDPRALRSKQARFELVGVSHRLDRAHVRKEACGEARFLYRLAYATKQGAVEIASRLPATLAVTFWLNDGTATCAAIAQRAVMPKGGVTAPWIASASGPFGDLKTLRNRFKSVESNVQLVRWPSTVRPDLGGHAEYVLRVFEPQGAALAPAPLENTPDVAKLGADRAGAAALEQWVRENLDAIESGTALLPTAMLATRSVSVSPRGFARLANRPFRRLLEPTRLADLAPTLKGRSSTGSPEALVRRLDQLSCPGCHQTRSVAGFHLLGEDRVAGANSIALALSPHAQTEIDRRKAFLAAVARGEPMPRNPSPERSSFVRGTYGAHCGLGDPGFAAWTCEASLECDRGDRAKGEDTLVGTCLPKAPGVGDPCEHAIVSREANAMRDRATIERAPCATGAVCDTNEVGFPGGMCATACSSPGPDGVCAGIPILTSFNACLARNEPFEGCIAANTRPASVRGCDPRNACRDDYICAGAPAVARGQGKGACMPPYFLFQLRVDGHPSL